MALDQLYQKIFEQTSDAFIVAQRDGRILLWNHGAEELFGYTAESVVGNSLDIIIPSPLRPRHWEAFCSAMAAGKTQLAGRAMITRALHQSGKYLYVDLSFAVLKDEAGTAIGALAIGRDITERYLAEKNLRKRLVDLERLTNQYTGFHWPAGSPC